MVIPIQQFKIQLADLASIDFSKHDLVVAKNSITAAPMATHEGHTFKTSKSALAPQVEQYIEKVKTILEQNPECLKDLEIVDHLLVLQNNFSNHLKGTKPDTEMNLDKLNAYVIKTALAHGEYNYQTLEANLTHDEAKTAVQQHKEQAATTIQKAFRGRQTRKAVVSSEQLQPQLKEHLIDPSKAEIIAKGLSREITEMALNPDEYRGKSKRLDAQKWSYPDFKYEKEQIIPQKPAPIEYDCWLEMSKDGKKIKVLLKAKDSQAFLDSGTIKDIYSAQSFQIDISLNKEQQRMIYHPKIIFKVKEEFKGTSVDKTIKNGIEIQKKVLETFEGTKVCALPKSRKSSALPNDQASRMEMKQDWYHSDLLSAGFYSRIRPSMQIKERTHPFTLMNQLSALNDVATVFQDMHSLGYVHRDLKPDNVFIKLNDDGTTTGYLADFDQACSVGIDNMTGEVGNWDKATCFGYVTPFCDVFGSALSLGTLMMPNFNDTIYDNHSLAIHSMILDPLMHDAVDISTRKLIPESIRVSLRNKLKPSKVDASYHLEEKLEIINKFLEENPSLTPAEKKAINTLVLRLQVMDQAMKYVREMILLDDEIYKFVGSDTTIQKLIKSDKLEDKLELKQRLEDKFPKSTIEYFQRQLEELMDLANQK